MVTSGGTTTYRGSWVLGDYVKASIASLLIGGSLVVGNNVYFTAGKNSDSLPSGQSILAPSLYNESGSFLTHLRVPITSSGQNLMAAFIPIPSSVFQSGAVLHRYSVEGDVKPRTITGSIVIQSVQKLSVANSVAVRHFIRVFTGSLVTSSTGATMNKIPAGGAISFISNTGSNLLVNGSSWLNVWLSAKKGR